MNINSAVNRIKWRIEKGGWQKNSNNEDVKSLNEIIRYVNKTQKDNIKNHELFAKLYVLIYSQFLDKHKADVYDEIPIKELHKLISRPFAFFIHDFTNKLNDINSENLFDKLGISKVVHPATITKEQNEKELDALEEAIKDEDNNNALYRNAWTYEIVQEIITNQINQFLNTYYYDRGTED